MKSSQHWFIFNLRLALAIYFGFMQFFIYIPEAQAQSSDPGSLQQQIIQRRVEREVNEKKGTASKNKVSQNKMRVKTESGSQADGTVLTVPGSQGKEPSYIFVDDETFDLISKNQPSAKTGKPKTMSLKEVVQEADAIRDYVLDSPIDQNSKSEFDKLTYDAQRYNEYKAEMQKFEDSAISSKLLKFAEGVQFENITREGILNERQAIAGKKLGAVVHEANVRFPKDTATFFILIGAVIALELMFKNGGDPLAMQHHFESLTDPIANLSFYSFILANGISLHYLKLGATKRLIDMNHRLLFAHLPMLSMPFASLVSNVVSDTAMTIKACADEITNPKEAAKKKKEDELIYTACDEALRQWTFENKANQYIPQLISLTLSNAPFIALGYGTQKVAKKLQVYQFMGAETKLVKVGGRLLMTGLKFMLSPIPAIALDMLITNPLATRIWSTKSDDIRIDNAKERLLENANNCHLELRVGGKVPLSTPKPCQQLKDDALILRDRSQSWRATINSDFETGFASWSTLMTKFNNQFNAAQGLYSYVFNLIMDYHYTKTICDTYKVLKHCEYMETVFGLDKFVLTKKYPLIGAKVDPKIFNSSAEGDSPEEYAVKLKNAFSDLAGSADFVKAQIANIRAQAKNFLSNRSLSPGSALEQKIYSIVVGQLRSENMLEVIQGVEELFTLYKEVNTNPHVSPRIKAWLMNLRKDIGDIKTIKNNGEGFLWARSFHSQFDDARTTQEYKFHHIKYSQFKFPTTAHYLMHEMLCGNSKGEMVHLLDFDKMFGTDREIGKIGHAYTPPRLIKDSKKLHNFCHSAVIDMDYSMVFNPKTNVVLKDNGYAVNPTQYLLGNYDFNLFNRLNEYGELHGTVESNGFFKLKKKESYFSDWWADSNKEMMDKFISEAKEDWKRIYTELILSFKNRGYVQDPSQRISIVKKAKGLMSDYTDQPKNSLDVILSETNIYFDLLKKLNLNDTSKKSLRRMDAVIDYIHAQNQAIEFLSTIFDLNGARSERQIEAATQQLPDTETTTKHQEALAVAMSQLKSFFIYGETESILKGINTDLIYALEASNTDLNKYLMSAFVIGLKDKEALRKDKEMKKKMQKAVNLNSQGQGVRKSGN